MQRTTICIGLCLTLVLCAGAGLAQGNKADELNRPKDYSNDFQVAPKAGAPEVANITEDFEGGVPPTGILNPWTTIDNAGTGIVWDNIGGTYCPGASNYTNGSGNAACVDSDAIGILDFDTELWTEVYNFTNAQNPALLFTANYQNFANEDFFQVDWSTDAGATWNNLLTWNEDHGTFRGTPGEDVNLALAPAVGAPEVWFRFYYWDPAPDDWEWYIQVDDFVLDDDTAGLIVPGSGVPTLGTLQLMLLALLLGLGGASFLAWRRRTV